MKRSWLILCVCFSAFSASSALSTDQRIADAIRKTEGTWTYGIKTISVRNEQHARQICLNTIRNNYQRWLDAGKPGEYLDFLADRYCPPSADAEGNRNWKRNVRYFLAKS